MENINTRMTQDDLIRILEYILKNNSKFTSADSIKNALFPEMDNVMFNRLFRSSLFVGIKPLTVYLTGDVIDHIAVYDGFGEYVKNLKQMVKKEKLHRILEFICTEYSNSKQSFDSGEIAKAFKPELSIYEINSLCKILIENEDVIDVTTSDTDIKSMVAILVTTKTHTAYHTERYLNEEDELFNIPIHQNISAKNVFVGNVSGNVTQEANSTQSKGKGKPKWLKWLAWIGGAIIVTLGIIEAIIRIF